MRKFTKIIEKLENSKFYKTTANIELIIEAENEGEAGYISDSILSSIEESYDYTILNIEETEDRINEDIQNKADDINQLSDNKTIEEQIELAWQNSFGGKTPTKTEKMEWYHNMRKEGYDGIKIFKVLQDKF